MTPCIMPFDMLELRRLAKRRHIPVQLSHPSMQIRIPRSNISEVCLEVLHIDTVKPDDGGEETDIGFSDTIVEVVLSF